MLKSFLRGLKRLFRKNKSCCGRIAIIGGGSWATALAKIVIERTNDISWYMRREDRIKAFKRTGHNEAYLSEVHFNVDEIDFSTDLNKIIRNNDTLIFVTPSPYIKQHMAKVTESLKDKFIVIATKGIVPDDNMLISEYFHLQYGVPRTNIACLIGPSHAEEVAMNRMTYLTVGCENIERAKSLAETIQSDYLQVRTSTDIQGIEYAAVLKNIYAIGAGICHGLKYGDNFQAVYMANAAREMSDVLNQLSYSENRNIADSVYLGDLLVTGYSDFSRNRVFGTMLGEGYSILAAQTEMQMIAEGYYGAKCIKAVLTQHKSAGFPIIDAVYNILYEKGNAAEIVKKLTLQFK